MIKKFIIFLTLILILSTSNAGKTIDIIAPDNADGNYVKGTFLIVFDIYDHNGEWEFWTARARYCTDNLGASCTLIGASDTNLLTAGVCDDTNFETTSRCSIPFVTSAGSPPDGNYFIDINFFTVIDSNTSDINALIDVNSTYIDNTNPTATGANPATFTTLSTSTPIYSVTVADANAGLDYCTADIYYDGSTSSSSTSTVTPSGGLCSKQLTLTWMQMANVKFTVYDLSGNNANLTTDDYEYSISGSGSPSNVPEGSGSTGIATPIPPVIPEQIIVTPPLTAMPAQAQVGRIPFVSDAIDGFWIVTNMILDFFRFK